MKSFSVLAVALLAAIAQAVQFTNSGFDVEPGKAFTITWSGATGPVTIKLKNGPPTNLKDVATITSKFPPPLALNSCAMRCDALRRATQSPSRDPPPHGHRRRISGQLLTLYSPASGSGGSFVWTVPTTLVTDKYALEIVDSTGVPNYSVQFDLTGTGTASSTVSSAASTSATTTSASASTTASTTATLTRSTTSASRKLHSP
jgi:hypothetical protein